MAVENKEWYQKVDMNYIDLGNGNKIKVDYILMDEMCLYIIFDFESEEDISKYNDLTLPDLKITDDAGNIICNLRNPMSCTYRTDYAIKKVKLSKHHIEELAFIYAEKIPLSKCLSISFSKVRLSGKNNKELETEVEFQINLDDKFVNRTFVTYVSDSPEIEKAIISNTGFYAIVSVDYDANFTKPHLFNKDGISYECSHSGFLYNEQTDNFNYLILSSLNSAENEFLKLVINNTEYILHK